MISETTLKFRKAYSLLPENVKESTRKAYKLWQVDMLHPSLSFKQVHSNIPIFSVRVSLSYRALCTKVDNDTYVWFWIGSHANYDKLLKQF